MEEVGELHVDGSHGACVLHDPVFVHIWGIVVAGGASRRAQKRERERRQACERNCLYLGPIEDRCILCA